VFPPARFPAPRFLRHPLPELLHRGAAQRLETPHCRVIRRPLRQAAVTQKIFVVQAQLLEAALGHPGQLHFHFLGRGGVHATLGDVLPAAAGGLHHLVMGAAAPVNEAVAEPDGHVVAQAGQLKGFELPISAMFGNQAVFCWCLSVFVHILITAPR